MDDLWKPLLIAGACIAILAILYHTVIRPWHLRWGTIDDEATRPLPGDDFAPETNAPATHAISINASAEVIWPWLVQMGQGRGGFYSYTWLENLVGCQMKNANEIVSEWQRLEVGDPISLHPKAPRLKVIVLDEHRALVLGGRPEEASDNETERKRWEKYSQSVFSWAFVLNERSEDHTRLIVRAKGHVGVGWKASLMNYLTGEPAHFIMERKMLLGIKRRVEQTRRET
jgi:hypothetical protein